MRLEFKGDGIIETKAAGKTLLELSLEQGIPHIHECFGSARCSTCRVRILSGMENLSERNEAETRIGAMKGWPDAIRLACQTRPSGDVVLKRLVLDDEDIRLAWSEVSRLRSGIEKEIVILFLDIEKFTGFTENNLPYDVIHIMNKFFNRLGDIILGNDGYIDKFIGDSIMALYGIEEDDIRKASLDATVSAVTMTQELADFNAYLRDSFDHEFGIRIGISAGPVILGNLGHRDKAHYTALGDAVNTASRLESANKTTGTRILVAKRIHELIGDEIVVGGKFQIKLRGQSQDQSIYELLDVAPRHRSRVDGREEKSNTAPSTAAVVADLPADLQAWETDNDHTEIGFEIDYLTTTVRGIFRVHLVDIRYDETRPERTALSAIIKTSSIDTFVTARDNHLRSADFFDSDHYPNMTYQSKGLAVETPDGFNLKGDLTIRDVSREVELKVQSCPPMADAWGVYKRGFIAEAAIDRYDFGIPFNLPLPTGESAIGREVRVKLILQLSKAGSVTVS